MKYTNITDKLFWDSAYKNKDHHYYMIDPMYGAKGLLKKSLDPWLLNAKNVLELGCGASRFLMFFNLIAKLQTYGIDFSHKGIQNLQKMAKGHKVNHILYYGDMFEHNLDGKKFDIVFHSGLVEHFQDLNVFFDRCRFFCKPDGLMLFFMPNMQNKAWSWHGKICPQNYSSHIPYTKEQIIKALEPFFLLQDVRSWGYLQFYAGGPPETYLAMGVKYLNLFLIMLTTLFVFDYKGNINQAWSSSWLFICRPKG